jgi:hypothetical protein
VVYTTGNQNISGVKTFENQTNVSGIKFDSLTIADIPSYQQGLTYYSDENHTLNIHTDVSGVIVPVGQRNLVRVKNGLSTNLNIGNVVYITGTHGNNPGVQLSIANTEESSAKTLGVISNFMTPNEPGYVTTFGIVDGINTSSYSVGTTLYLSPSGSGQMTNIKPYAPNHMVRIGTVLTSKNDGSIFVTVQNGFELDELHDALIQSPASGDLLSYSGNVWKNSSVESILSNQNIFYTTGNQEISGIKNFAQRPTVSGVPVFLSGDVGVGLPTPSGTGIQYLQANSGVIEWQDSWEEGFANDLSQLVNEVQNKISNEPSDETPVNFIRVLTQSGYDALGTYDDNTLYFIK